MLECQNCTQFSWSLSSFLLEHLPSFSLTPCVYFWLQAGVSLHSLCLHSLWKLFLRPCKVESHWGWAQRVSTHLANTEESSLLPVHSSKCPVLCMYTFLKERGLWSDWEVDGRKTRLQRSMITVYVGQGWGELEPAWTRIKRKVQLFQDGVSKVLRGSIQIFFVLMLCENIRILAIYVWCDPYLWK